jgi:hypothetical protein
MVAPLSPALLESAPHATDVAAWPELVSMMRRQMASLVGPTHRDL